MKNLLFLFLSGVLLMQFNSCTSKKGGEGIEDVNKVVLDYTNAKTDWTTNNELTEWHAKYMSDPANATYKKDSSPRPYQYVDFKLEELKHLIWLMEKSAKLTYEENQKPEMGLRVHYVQYASGDNEGLNSVVLSPIFKDNDRNKTFNPRSEANIKNKSFQPWEINRTMNQGGSGKLFMYFIPPYDDEGTNLNHGSGCPERCD